MTTNTTGLHCFHCDLPVTTPGAFTLEHEGEIRQFCCPGCQAVAQTILASGMGSYYQFRTQPAHTPDFADLGQRLPEEVQQELTLFDAPDVQQEFVHTLESGLKEATLSIEGITCAACVWLLEKRFEQTSGVETVSLNLSNHRMVLSWSEATVPLSALIQQIYELGYKAYPFVADQAEHTRQQENKQALRRLALAGIGAMQVMMLAVPLYIGDWSGIAEEHALLFRFAALLLTTPVVLYSARPFFVAAYQAIKNRYLIMDVPVSLAIGLAYGASCWSTLFEGEEVYFDSVCMFTFFLLIGRYMEMRARHKAGDAGNRLLRLLPASAIKLVDGQPMTISAKQLKSGDIVLVKTGATLPADGQILSGCSGIDESALTGESLPVTRQVGDNVMGGTLNMEHPLTIKVSAVGAQSRISTIVRLLDRAQQEKPAIAQLADKLSGYFVLATLLVASGVMLYWSQVDPSQAFWIMLSVLVVTCPCALSLATPTALTTATGSLSRQGMLITKGHVLEGLTQVSHVIFDKTGTLTEGNLALEETHPLAELDQQTCLIIAAALEAQSEHPIAKAFSPYFQQSASQLSVATGKGIEGLFGQTRYRIGRPDYVAVLNGQLLQPPARSGQWLLLGSAQGPLCWFRLSDQLRKAAPACIQALKQQGLTIELLSGDQSSAAQEIGEQLALDHVVAGATPADKLARIASLQAQGHKVLMVGDGINDVPVLAGAQVSIAMGNASDLAKGSADMLLTSGNLMQISDAIGKARKTRRIIKENLAWSLLYNLCALPMATMGLIPPYLAAAGMSASSLIVVVNALRLSQRT